MIETRKQKGQEIAALSMVRHTEDADGWFVGSQTGPGKYKVTIEGDSLHCTCPDFQTRVVKCKHMYAVEFSVLEETRTKVERNDRGETTITKVVRTTKTARITYPQNWPAYNAAQTNEKRLFLSFLHELCSSIEQPVQIFGRPRLPYADMVFSAAFKVYSTVSGRRFTCDLEDAFAKGYLSKAPHYNSIFNYLELTELTPILQDLIKRSSLPLRAIETDFCVDSSGFASSRFVKWFEVKHKGYASMHDWLKLHVMCGTLTNIVTSVEVTGRDSHDAPHFPALVNKTAENFPIREVSADKAYSTRKNLQTVENVGGTAYIPFKSNATGAGTKTGKGEGVEVWNRMYHYYSLNKEDFLAHYHKRSNSESTFSMIKAKFGDGLRSRTPVAQTNEALCKVICHNICVVIQSVFELGIEPAFCAELASA